MSRRVLLIGDPVAHSVSPAMHRAAFAVVGLPWDYATMRVRADQLAGAWAGILADRTVLGLNVTIPLKEAIVPLLDQPYIRDPGKTIQDLVNETIARVRENVVIRRFARFELGGS